MIQNKDTFDQINELLIALSHLLWPIGFIITVFLFRKEISQILKRIKKGKFLGQELELEKKKVKEFKQATAKASESISEIEIIPVREDNEIDNILSKSAEDPKVGILLLSREIEKEIKMITASLGNLSAFQSKSLNIQFELLAEHKFINKDALHSVRQFWDLRNRIIHGSHIADNELVIQVLDIGVTLLRILRAIPHSKHFVYKKNVELFSDNKLMNKREDVVGLIIEAVSPGGLEKSYHIYPTQKRDYHEGNQIAWEWDFSHQWGESWYKDPIDNEIKMAFIGAVEFVGRHIEEL